MTLLCSLARGHGADHSGAAWVQRFPAPPAADPTGNAGHRAEPQRSCSATTRSLRGQEIFRGQRRLGRVTTVVSHGPYISAMGRGLGGSRGPYGAEEVMSQHPAGTTGRRDGAADGLSRIHCTPRQADDTTTRPSESGSGSTRQSDVRDSEPDPALAMSDEARRDSASDDMIEYRRRHGSLSANVVTVVPPMA